MCVCVWGGGGGGGGGGVVLRVGGVGEIFELLYPDCLAQPFAISFLLLSRYSNVFVNAR